MVPENLVNADDVYNPDKLYEALETSVSGIAEFITPAIFAGHIHSMGWIRPPWANQIRDGTHSFLVGKQRSSGNLRVSCREPYFADEGFCVKDNDLEDAKRFSLKVAQLQYFSMTKFRPPSPWILDICLDYFTVNNPFLKEYEMKAGKLSCDLLRQVFGLGLKWRQCEEQRISNGPGYAEFDQDTLYQRKEKEVFESLISRIFEKVLEDNSASELSSLVDQLSFRYRNRSSMKPTLLAFVDDLKTKTPDIIKLANTAGEMADLPENLTDQESIDKMIMNLESFLYTCDIPKVVTIARSSSDEFDYTPINQVEEILQLVLKMLKRLWGSIDVEYDPT
mmetsp:Transcript_33754/g.41553  ORF Transcript_33754/g.41553 Transcript_33754/m.41553 type:complete len:336 (+) Transcript_33754:89-1096(+)